MYKFTRSECPDYLALCWESLTVQHRQAKENNPKHKFYWYAGFKYDTTLDILFTMNVGHCAFCDGGGIGEQSRKTIEHFKPKSLYPDLAYKWENLYPCCDQCQSQKRERFDPDLLIADDMAYQFDGYFMLNYSTGAIEPSAAVDSNHQRRAQVTIEHYGLNLPERKKGRLRELQHYQRRDKEVSLLDDFSYRYFLQDWAD
ncbi:MAG: hypothetical protein RSA68_06970 [Hafnia sp.]|uniref:hypothetical protein n=1 Tax=Hafnia sp. TaxID=1873498 RepID=UPI002FC9C191